MNSILLMMNKVETHIWIKVALLKIKKHFQKYL